LHGPNRSMRFVPHLFPWKERLMQEPHDPSSSRWTPALRERFLGHLSAGGDVRAAAARCGLSRQSVYKLRERDPAFARAWDAALAGRPGRRAQVGPDELRRMIARRRKAIAERHGEAPAAEFAARLAREAGLPAEPFASQ